jgi:membrane protease YdiL (CAAX protease family)
VTTIDSSAQQRARTGVGWYLALVLLGSAPCYAGIILLGAAREQYGVLFLVLMWVPALAAFLLRWRRGEGFADVSFTLRGPHVKPMLLLAWLAPLLIGLSAYPIAWLTGLETFEPPPMERVGMPHSPPLLELAASIGLNLTAGTLLSAISATGEELGWRGYMLTRLIDAKLPRPVLLGGVIWAAWHMPLIFAGVYAVGRVPWLSPPTFAVTIIAASFVFARVRLESGSVWPAVLLHSSWNALIQGTFDKFTHGGDAGHALWTGESGPLVAGFTVLYAWLLARSKIWNSTARA